MRVSSGEDEQSTNAYGDAIPDRDPDPENRWWIERPTGEWRLVQQLEPEQRTRCLLQEDMFKLSMSSYPAYIAYVRRNENRIRHAGWSDRQKNDLAGIAQRANGRERFATESDRELLRSLFGNYVYGKFFDDDIRAQRAEEGRFTSEPMMNPDEEIAYYMDSTYATFKKWVSKPSTMTVIKSASQYQKDMLCDHLRFGVQMMKQATPKQEHYTEADQPIFDKVLEQIE